MKLESFTLIFSLFIKLKLGTVPASMNKPSSLNSLLLSKITFSMNLLPFISSIFVFGIISIFLFFLTNSVLIGSALIYAFL